MTKPGTGCVFFAEILNQDGNNRYYFIIAEMIVVEHV
jgi:hypothetical protein